MTVFFANSRLWLGANLRCLRWKRIALGGNKERFVQHRKLLVYGNGKFLRTAKKGLCKRKAFCAQKGGF